MNSSVRFLSYADPLRADGGRTIAFIGDSLGADTAVQFADVLGLTINVLSISGDCIADQANEAFALLPANGDITCLWLGTNDKNLGADNSDRESNTQKGHLALIFQCAIPEGSNKVHAQSMTVVSGSWSNLGATVDPRGRYSSTNGSTLETTVTGTSVAVVATWNAAQAGQFSVTIDGVLKGTYAATPAGAQAPSEDIDYGPFALVFGGLSSGSHAVRIAVTSATNASNVVYVDFVAGLGSTIDTSWPLVLVGNLHEFTAAGNTAQGVTAGRNARYNTIISSNVTQARGLGLNVKLVDIDAAIGDSDLGPDGVHMTHTGYTKVRDAFVAAYQ